MQDNASIIDVTEQNIQQVLESSRQIPVLFDFWASWCQPCLQMAPLLEKLAGEYQGKFLLAKVDADAQQNIAAQFGVRSLPSLKLVYQGQLVSELDGAQTEGALRQWLAPVVDPDAAQAEQEEQFLEQVRQAIEAGHGGQAEQALRQTLSEQPDKHAFRALLVEYLLGEGAPMRPSPCWPRWSRTWRSCGRSGRASRCWRSWKAAARACMTWPRASRAIRPRRICTPMVCVPPPRASSRPAWTHC